MRTTFMAVAGVCCTLLPLTSRAQRPAPLSAEQAARLETAARATSLGIRLSPALSRVLLPESATPSQDDIVATAKSSRTALDALRMQKQKHQTFLGLAVGLGDVLVQVGQYAGGGGAIVFGLAASNGSAQDASKQGRNAAYSGALAAGVTLLKGIFHLDAKKAAEVACAKIDQRYFGLMSQTRAWEGQASSSDYRAGFFGANGDFQKFNDEVNSFSIACFQPTDG